MDKMTEQMAIEEVIENLENDCEIDMYIRNIAPQIADWLKELKTLKEKAEPKKVLYQDVKKERLIKSDEDCADCLCRVCARNSCNDSYNIELEGGYANCSCNCSIGDKLIETEDDCPNFLPDEDLL